MFMRSVHPVLFEQMKGRGVRVSTRMIPPSPRRWGKTFHRDCVGVTEKTLSDTKPLEKNPSVAQTSARRRGGRKRQRRLLIARQPARERKHYGPEKKLIADTSRGVAGDIPVRLRGPRADQAGGRQMFAWPRTADHGQIARPPLR
jgi:hypothetical protein